MSNIRDDGNDDEWEDNDNDDEWGDNDNDDELKNFRLTTSKFLSEINNAIKRMGRKTRSRGIKISCSRGFNFVNNRGKSRPIKILTMLKNSLHKN